MIGSICTEEDSIDSEEAYRYTYRVGHPGQVLLASHSNNTLLGPFSRAFRIAMNSHKAFAPVGPGPCK